MQEYKFRYLTFSNWMKETDDITHILKCLVFDTTMNFKVHHHQGLFIACQYKTKSITELFPNFFF